MALLLLSLLSLFLFAVPAVRAAPPEPVYDTDGHPLRRGESYYVLPVIRGGGLTLAQRHRMCPLYVAQESQEVKMGLPVTFSPVDSAAAADDTVRLSTDVNVRFDVVTVCVQSTVWRLGDTEGEKAGSSGGSWRRAACGEVRARIPSAIGSRSRSFWTEVTRSSFVRASARFARSCVGMWVWLAGMGRGSWA
uniref:Miraculin-like n=1 Tax=Ananas comosus var. bracteatus TaxID=296719 RepID=A0A6V7QM87_ANACO|nr:unnamed protein product [Ananas comosus var. bracteatus]